MDEIKHKFDDLLIQSNSGDIEKDNAIDELNKLAEEQESKIKELEEELQTRKEKNQKLLDENLNLKKIKSELETQITTLECKLNRDSKPSMPNLEEDSSEYHQDKENDEETKENKINKK